MSLIVSFHSSGIYQSASLPDHHAIPQESRLVTREASGAPSLGQPVSWLRSFWYGEHEDVGLKS